MYGHKKLQVYIQELVPSCEIQKTKQHLFNSMQPAFFRSSQQVKGTQWGFFSANKALFTFTVSQQNPTNVFNVFPSAISSQKL